MKLRCGGWVWLSLGLVTAGAAPVETPFQASTFPYEPRPPLLTHPDYVDVLRGATVTASAHDDEQRPGFVHDGDVDNTVMFWTSKVFPSWVKLELPETREIAQVNLYVRAPGTHTYRFAIEASADGTSWQMLRDALAGEVLPSSGRLEIPLAAPVRVRALRLTVTGTSRPGDGPYVIELAAFGRKTSRALEGAVGDLYHQYSADNVPFAPTETAWKATAWRGERVHGQFVVWTNQYRFGLRAEATLRDRDGRELPKTAVQTRFVRHVLADGVLTGDVLDDAARVDMPAGSFRAVWLTVETPRDAAPGVYTGTLTLRTDGGEPKEFPLSLEILPATLPDPLAWKFHLDIFQHPWSIARWHGVKAWSEEHFAVMRPYMTELARAGQKVITATITPRPWGSRDYDEYGTMVEHIRQPDGTWTFDYTVFDRYVEYAMSFGIDRQINCYSMLTWSGRMEYTDAATGDRRSAMCEPGSPEFVDYWAPFLRDFEKHLTAKGWLERTRIAVDEAPAPMMKAMQEMIQGSAPKIKIALAGNQEPSHYTGLDLADFTIILHHASDDLLREIAQRREEGRVTTFYVCLDPKRPNTFVRSPPAEAVWIGYYTSLIGYDGMARWAYTTWPENPLHETLYSAHPWRRDLPPGDEFMIYPGPRSAVHWEMLRDGIEEWEKLRLIREARGGQLPAELAARLENFRDPKNLGDDATVIRNVSAMRAAVEAASRELQ